MLLLIVCDQHSSVRFTIYKGVIVVVIAWELDLQLPVQSMTIAIPVVRSNSAYDEVYSIQ